MDFERTLRGVGELGGITRRSTRIVAPPMMPDKRETWVVQTTVTPDGPYLFLEVITAEGQAVRLAVPPSVANALYGQHDAIVRLRRSQRAKNAAETRKAAGVVPFVRKAV